MEEVIHWDCPDPKHGTRYVGEFEDSRKDGAICYKPLKKWVSEPIGGPVSIPLAVVSEELRTVKGNHCMKELIRVVA